VPFNSIFQSLKRLKIPDSFIDQVKKLLERSVCIDTLIFPIILDTPIGTTRIIHVEKGLPQGDPMSPILWNIFYDALLVELQELKGYTFTNNVQISNLAYADDIHPISDNQL
jgi:hypothetical protein